MEYAEVQGFKISRMTLGTVQLGLEYGIANKSGKPSLEKAFGILGAAAAGGVSAFDTAGAYGDSESVLGKYFSQAQPGIKKPFIATKFILKAQPGAKKSEIEREILCHAEASLKKLGIRKIPLFMLHRAHDMTRFGDAVPRALKRLKDGGLIEKAGVSVYKPEEAEQMLKYGVYEAVQLPMNAFDTRMAQSGVLEKLKSAGTMVFVRSVFLQGLFFLKPQELPKRLQFAAAILTEFGNIAREEGVNLAQLALSFIRGMEGVTSLVLGAETKEQVEENIRLMAGPALSAGAFDRLYALSLKVPIEDIMGALAK